MKVLVVNAGSSSIKLVLLDDTDEVVEHADLPTDADVAATLRGWPRPDAVGHRIVHGGAEFTQAVRIAEAVEARLHDLIGLAPLHQPKSLGALAAVSAALPEVPSVAAFDTAFHTTLSPAASTYAIPETWRTKYGIRRYGFHGLSHAYAARRAAEITDGADGIVTCHLGAGASLCAVTGGRSVDTTMGFTPLEGLVMATRSGSVDPGILPWLQEHQGLSPQDIEHTLEHESGLLALAGTADMREILSRTDARARLAFDVYVHRLAASIAAMAATAGGLATLVFTGGVGEHAPLVRSTAAKRLHWLGVSIDDRENQAAHGDADITGHGATVRCLVLTAREDVQIAGETRALLARD